MLQNLAEWFELVSNPLKARLDFNGLRMSVESIEVSISVCSVEPSPSAEKCN